jgi:hypothetical protein
MSLILQVTEAFFMHDFVTVATDFWSFLMLPFWILLDNKFLQIKMEQS